MDFVKVNTLALALLGCLGVPVATLRAGATWNKIKQLARLLKNIFIITIVRS